MARQNLIVPINVQALCISSGDETQHHFVQQRIDFTALPGGGINQINLSEKIVQPLFQDGKTSKKGIHLHWALPDALTQGRVNKPLEEFTLQEINIKLEANPAKVRLLGLEEFKTRLNVFLLQVENHNRQLKTLKTLEIQNLSIDENKLADITNHSRLEFPVVPNIWLVTRIITGHSELSQQWIVESDYLSEEQNIPGHQGIDPIAVVQENGQVYDRGKPYRYMGRALKLSDWQKNRNVSDARYSKLTAIGYGDITFASWYQNCSSVFGFCDKLEHIQECNVSYSVVGWYSENKNDFVNVCKQTKDQNSVFYNFSDESGNVLWKVNSANVIIENSIYSGIIRNIAWNPNKLYLDNNQTLGKVDAVVLAPSEIEALSTFLNHEMPGEAQQYFLNLCQLGYNKDEKSLKKHFDIEQLFHLKRFQQVDSGTVWTISTNFDKKNTSVNVSPPSQITEELDELNKAQQKYDVLRSSLRSFQWQTFSDWYKYMQISYHDLREASLTVTDTKKFLSKTTTYYQKLQAQIQESIKNLVRIKDSLYNMINVENNRIIIEINQDDNDEGKYSFQLTSSAAPKYYIPNDPTVLIKGKIAENYAGERNGPQTSDGIQCRVSLQLTQHQLHPTLTEQDSRCYNDINLLINEARILVTPQEDEKQKISRQIEEIIPQIAITDWHNTLNDESNTWLPHHIQWQVDYKPLANSKDGDNYQPDYIKNNFSFDIKDDQGIIRQGVELQPNSDQSYGNNQSYSGYTLLTPNAKYNLADRIREYSELFSDIVEKLGKITNIPILSQSLGGFNEALIMRSRTPQLQVTDPNAIGREKTFHQKMQQVIGNMNVLAPNQYGIFSPIQDGIISLKRIRVVDAFGRFKDLEPKSVHYPCHMHTEEIGVTKYVNLYPRIMQNGRISFRLLSHITNSPQEIDSRTKTNPIYGWVMTNNLDNSLAFYTQDGRPIGSLKIVDSVKIKWEASPVIYNIGEIYNFGQSLDQTLSIVFQQELSVDPQYVENSRICQILKSIFDVSSQNKSSKYLQSLINVINEAISHITPEGYSNNFANAYLFGRPLAIVEAVVKLELQGLPVNNVSNKSLEKEIKAKAEINIEEKEFTERINDRFTDVLFPVRLGNYDNFQDGLVGYFLEEEENDNGNKKINYQKFYALCGNHHDGHGDNISTKQGLELPLSYNNIVGEAVESTKNVLILMDPRAAINITTGILPTKQITIPEDAYLKALQQVYITFLTTPVISEVSDNEMIIPVSTDDKLKWSWIEINKGQIKEKAIPASGNRIFANGQQISEGWMKLSPKL